MGHRLRFLDIVRIVSMALVMFGHFVTVATLAPDIPGIIDPAKVVLPLISSTDWNLWKLESKLIETFSTQSAIVGVTLFFIVTGYLMPMMMERYTRIGFLINRMLRIFPTLIVGTSIIAAFVFLTQGIAFEPLSFIGSWTLTYQFIPAVPIAGILWTLVVEMIFYFVSFAVGKFNFLKVLLIQIVIIGLIVISYLIPQNFYLDLLVYSGKFIFMIAIGSAIFLAERESRLFLRVALVVEAVVVAYFGFRLNALVHIDETTYRNIGTILVALFLFFSIWSLSIFGIYKKLPKTISWLAELVFPVYIMHVSLGLGAMAIFRDAIPNPYALLVISIAITLAVAWVLHVAVELPGIRVGRALIKRIEHRPDEKEPNVAATNDKSGSQP